MTGKLELMEAVEAVNRFGSKREAARVLGIPKSTLLDRYNKAVSLGYHVSEGIQQSVNSSKLGFNEAKAGWIVDVDKETGSRRSTYWKAPEIAQESLIDAIKTAFEGITPAQPVPAPKFANSELLTIYPVADFHLGIMTWAEEVGEDFDTEKSVERLKSWIGQMVDASPPSETAIILGLGDFTHSDSQANVTPKSKHQVDVATRHFKTLNMAISSLAASVELALIKHKKVIVRILRGNHDEESHKAILFSINSHFRLEDRVEVIVTPHEYFAYEFGVNMFVAAHGDKAKPQQIVMFSAAYFSEMWGRTKKRFLFTGHKHSSEVKDFAGMKWEQVRALSPPSPYDVSMGYFTDAQLQAITYQKDKGEYCRFLVTA